MTMGGRPFGSRDDSANVAMNRLEEREGGVGGFGDHIEKNRSGEKRNWRESFLEGWGSESDSGGRGARCLYGTAAALERDTRKEFARCRDLYNKKDWGGDKSPEGE